MRKVRTLKFRFDRAFEFLFVSVVSVDETGDFIASRRHESGVFEQIVFGTLFKTRRVYDHPIVDLTSFHREIPPYPQPVSVGPPSLLSSWFRYGKPIMTGEQLDALRTFSQSNTFNC
jgi:syntaxin-binding protein 5